jgi:hypothetical protein
LDYKSPLITIALIAALAQAKKKSIDMKLFLLASLLSLCVTGVFAQDSISVATTTYPIWTVSKPVQALQFRNSVFRNARIYTGNAWTLTKGIHQSQLMRSERLTTHKVKFGNVPSAVISKGVARMQYERNNKQRD